jgi:hypothetical protein
MISPWVGGVYIFSGIIWEKAIKTGLFCEPLIYTPKKSVGADFKGRCVRVSCDICGYFVCQIEDLVNCDMCLLLIVDDHMV